MPEKAGERRVIENTCHLVTVQPSGQSLEVPDNANLREALLKANLPLYGVVARFVNCGGNARCGTCIVAVLGNAANLSPKTPFETRLRPKGPEHERLACQAMVRGSVTIRVGR